MMGLKLAHAVMRSGLGIPAEGGREVAGRRVRGPRRDHILRLVALALAVRADDETGGDLFPRVGTIAADVGCHRTQVQRALRVLKAGGILEVEKRSAAHSATRHRFVAAKLPQRGDAAVRIAPDAPITFIEPAARVKVDA